MEDLFYYNNIKFKILTGLRGELSQIELSKQLGFNFNQVHKWEVGSKAMSLHDFSDYCAYFGVSVKEAFLTVFMFDIESLDQKKTFEKYYKFFGPDDKTELARLLDINRSTLYRWFDGKGSPDLALLFYWIDKRTQYLADLVHQIVGEQSAWSILSEKKPEATRRLKYAEIPSMAAIEAYIRLNDYKKMKVHSNELIAINLNLPVTDVALSINELERCGEIRLVGEKYIVQPNRTDIGHIDTAASAKIAKYWTNKCLERFSTTDGVPNKTGDPSNMWCYRVLPVPSNLETKVKEKLSRCYMEIIEMMEEYECSDGDVKAIVIHYFNVKD
jgi:transcriptional regulator with XRE-family HTH domain